MRKSLFIFGILLVAALPVFGHKYHTSLTRIDHRADEKNLEITIRLFVHDVVPMLGRRLKKQVDPERTPEVDAELLKYIAENFTLRVPDQGELKLSWVGKEFESDVLFVYLEAGFDGDPAGLSLRNTIFFDYFPEQSNLVVAKFADKKRDLAFRVGDGFKELAPK